MQLKVKAYLTLPQANESATYQNYRNKEDFASSTHTINEGKIAEKKICEYYDHLVSCNNPGRVDECVKPTKHPCRNDFKTAVIDEDSDYFDLVNSVQRHAKFNSAYCLREDNEGNQYCTFQYPFALESGTYLRYNEVPGKGGKHFKVEIVAESNNPRVNRHQRIQLQGWYANCDIQLVIDHHAYVYNIWQSMQLKQNN